MANSPGARPAFITFSATLQAIGSLLLFCLAMGSSISHVSIIYGVLAAIGLSTAFGNFRLKKWARYSTLALSTLLVLLPFGMNLDFVHLDNIASNSGNPADADAMQYIVSFEIGLMVIKMLIALPMAALGGFWLYYFNRRSVKRLFANAEGESN